MKRKHKIYITVCFYLNKEKTKRAIIQRENLHYSMFLFKLLRPRVTFFIKVIYITVCFYLNVDILLILNRGGLHLHYSMFLFKLMYSIFCSRFYIRIYITVCFYLNVYCFITNITSKKFTLQYVSI